MEYTIKEVHCDDLDFKNLCTKLDEYLTNLVPERIIWDCNSLNGLEKLQKVLLLYYNDKAVASVGLKAVNETTAMVSRVYVEDMHRGKGLGKLLVNKISEFAKDMGYKRLVLNTWQVNKPAIELYKKLGFVETSRIDMDTSDNASFEKEDYKIQKIKELSIFMKKEI